MAFLTQPLHEFQNYLEGSAYSINTVDGYLQDLRQFQHFCQEQDVKQLREITADLIRQYLVWEADRGRGGATQARRLSSLGTFCSWAIEGRRMRGDNPVHLVEVPTLARRTIQTLTPAQVVRLLEAPDTQTVLGQRDRTILEVLYGCGLRVTELIDLELGDIDEQALVVENYNQHRRVPLPPLTKRWLEDYSQQVRPLLVQKSVPQVFLTLRGEPFSRQGLHKLVSRHARTADLKEANPRVLRNTFAVSWLTAGGDLGELQQIFGHVKLETTRFFTEVLA